MYIMIENIQRRDRQTKKINFNSRFFISIKFNKDDDDYGDGFASNKRRGRESEVNEKYQVPEEFLLRFIF